MSQYRNITLNQYYQGLMISNADIGISFNTIVAAANRVESYRMVKQ